MNTIAWVYLFIYALDATFSLASLVIPQMENTSSNLSSAVVMITCVVFVLAVIKKLKPRNLFLILSGYYLLVTILSAVLGVQLAMTLGPDALKVFEQNRNTMIPYLSEQFAWFKPVLVVLGLTQAALAVYGIRSYKAQNPYAAPAAPVATP